MTDKPEKLLQKQAWERAMKNKKPKSGTPHDWEDYENKEKSESL
jgi:hypothetical protein